MALLIMGIHDMHICANDQFDAEFRRRFVGLHQAEKIVMIGDGHGGHTQLRHPVQGRAYAQQAINEGIFGMKTEMDERGHKGTLSHLGVRQQAFHRGKAPAVNRCDAQPLQSRQMRFGRVALVLIKSVLRIPLM